MQNLLHPAHALLARLSKRLSASSFDPLDVLLAPKIAI